MKKVLLFVSLSTLMMIWASCDSPESRAKDMAKKACNCYANPTEECSIDLIAAGTEFDEDFPDASDQLKFYSTYKAEVRKQCPLYANDILSDF